MPHSTNAWFTRSVIIPKYSCVNQAHEYIIVVEGSVPLPNRKINNLCLLSIPVNISGSTKDPDLTTSNHVE